MKKITLFAFFALFHMTHAQELSFAQAEQLASLPLKCMMQEYPNKLNQVVVNDDELLTPKTLHPAFYGCFDWHSAVHGHWSLVYLLEIYPNLKNKNQIIQQLQSNLTQEKIQKEIDYFSKPHEKSFERTYGWAWLLKLQHALNESKADYAPKLAQNLQPLTDLLVQRYLEFLPKLNYPVRAGTHNNTAFGLSLAWDYAVFAKHEALQTMIKSTAIRLFQADVNCSFDWEPSGTDFLSPCMEELALMERVLPKKDFIPWAKAFAPKIFNKNYTWDFAKVSDRSDGHLVHLDGLNFSRAWNFYHLIHAYPKEFEHLKKLADAHLSFSLPSIVDGQYEGEHWLASFALRAFEEKNKRKF